MTATEQDEPITEAQIAAAEADPGTDTGNGDTEPEPGTDTAPELDDDEDAASPFVAPQGMSEQQVERINRSLESEARRHAKRIVEIMGDDDAGVLEQCPLCLPLIPGFRYPQPPVAEQLEAVKAAIGMPAEPPLNRDQFSVLCEACDGWGTVATGSKVIGQGKVKCLSCDGFGFKPTDERRKTSQPGASSTLPPAVSYDQPMPDPVEPPEVTALKAAGYTVVPPIAELLKQQA